MGQALSSPYFLLLSVGTALLLALSAFFVVRGRRTWKTLPVITLACLVILSFGALTSMSAINRELSVRTEHLKQLATLLGREVAAVGGDPEKAEGLFARWMEADAQIVSMRTLRRSPDGQFVTLASSSTGDRGSAWPGSVSAVASAWSGSSASEVSLKPGGAVLAAIPLRRKGAASGVAAVLVVKYSNARLLEAAVGAEKSVLVMTALMVVFVVGGGLAGVELVNSLAKLRVSKAELILQGERIREQMDIIAEKNLAMAAHQDMLAQVNERLQNLATMDGLTGVMNHRSLMEFLSSHMKRNSVIGSPCSVVLLDVDNFKQLNDQYGHMAGDDALRTIAQVLRQSAPPGSGVGRYGGEEFMVVLPGASESVAMAVAEELRKRIQMAKMTSRQCTASIGVSTVYSMTKSEQTLIDEADKALYQSKRTGKNRVTHFGHGLLESA